MREMRMSRREIKEKYKQTEGDPQIKGRLRQLRRERAQRRVMANVPTASVVLVNPTHYAVALRYDMDKMAAPVLVAKGVDELARRIREVAEAHNVPLVSNPPLTQALHASVEIDEEILPAQYKAVADVISYLFRLQGKLKPARGGARRG